MRAYFNQLLERDWPEYSFCYDNIRMKCIKDLLTWTFSDLLTKDSGVKVDLNMTISQFIHLPVCNRPFPLIEGYFEGWCSSMITPLLHECFVITMDDRRELDAALKEAAVNDRSLIDQALHAESRLFQFTRDLLNDLVSKIGNRTLRSYFIRGVQEDGYIWSWDTASVILENGRDSKPLELQTEHGVCKVYFDKYYMEDSRPLIQAYEWVAELVQGNSDVLSRANGMIYKFRRENGLALADSQDLIWAADMVADCDVLEVRSFLSQHEDAEDCYEYGDLAMLSLWERHCEAPKGVGAECLSAAIQLIKKKFKSVQTVVCDVQPAQFINTKPEKDPPSIQVERQEAIEAIVEYLPNVVKHPLELRIIYNRDGNNPDAAWSALVGVSTVNILTGKW